VTEKRRLARLCLVVLGVLAGVGLGAMGTDLVIFYEEGCPHCARVEATIERIAPDYPTLNVVRHEIHDPDAQDLLSCLLASYGVELGSVPMFFVGDVAYVEGTYYGLYDEPYAASGRAEELALEQAIQRAEEQNAPSPLTRAQKTEGGGIAARLTLPAIILAAALDSVNPCDFAVLVLLLGTLLVIGKRGKVLWAGLAFSAGIFVAYFTMGFGLYSLLGLTVGTRAFRAPFIMAVSGVAILFGLWEMKDLFWYGKWFSIEVPDKWKPSVKKLTAAAVTIPGAFIVGLVDSLFLAPCTSGPYIVILTLLSQTSTRMQGAGYLLIYNLVFILPMIAITFAVHFGITTTARAERWRQAKLGKLHFATGLVMVLLGIGMIVGVQLGYL
jgi:cytochrome c biogenesis protein CcdA/glutaredoxin